MPVEVTDISIHIHMEAVAIRLVLEQQLTMLFALADIHELAAPILTLTSALESCGRLLLDGQ